MFHYKSAICKACGIGPILDNIYLHHTSEFMRNFLIQVGVIILVFHARKLEAMGFQGLTGVSKSAWGTRNCPGEAIRTL